MPIVMKVDTIGVVIQLKPEDDATSFITANSEAGYEYDGFIEVPLYNGYEIWIYMHKDIYE